MELRIVSLDLTVLRLLKYRSKHDRLTGGLPNAGLEETTTQLLEDYAAYYKEFPEVTSIDVPTFMLWFKEFRHTSYNAERVALLTGTPFGNNLVLVLNDE